MGLDIIEIALDEITDHVKFEKLASEIMRDEGYSNIKPLGGVSDMGQDAVQENYLLSESHTRVVFQYTLQDYIPGKIEDTIGKLSKANIEYHELVIVTPHTISSKRQESMIRDVRKRHELTLNIFDRKTLVNRLANYENGIFHRHFPDIEKQVIELTSKKPMLSKDKSGVLESSKLKASIAFTFSEDASHARKSILDFLMLGLLLESPSEYTPTARLREKYRETVGGEETPEPQIRAALERLASRGFVQHDRDSFRPTKLAIQTLASSTIEANEVSSSLISDIVDKVHRISGKAFSEQDKRTLARNTEDVLVHLFQLFGIELSNQVLRNACPAPVYLDSSEKLISMAKRRLSPEIGELLIAVICDILKSPTEEQAKALTNWSLTYLCVEIMNLDPNLSEFQATHFAKKSFVLDTDFILDCVVQECPRSATFITLIRNLKSLGCRVIIPQSCVEECVTHARFSPRTYDYFKEKLMALGESFVDEKVGNVFVKGYFYGRLSKSISSRTSFREYLRNYHELADPVRFLANVIHTILPVGVEIVNPTTLLTESIPEKEMSAMTDELFRLMLMRKKSEYRSPEENEELARTDARLFLTTLHLNGENKSPSEHILGGGSTT